MAGETPWPGRDEIAARLWDTCILGGTLLPGKVKIDITGELEIDKGKGGNQHGANIKIKGFKPREGTITWELWDRGFSDEQIAQTDAEWLTMQTVLEELEPVTGKAPTQPMAVYSPKLAARGVASLLVTKVAGPDYEQGVMKVVLTWTEFQKIAAAPKGSGKATSEKSKAGSEWEQVSSPAKDAAAIDAALDPNAPPLAKKAFDDVPTTANQSAPHNTETKP